MAEPLNAIPMNEIDIKDDDKLRYIQRVLESDAPRQDRDAAAAMVREIRTRIRRVYAARNAGVDSCAIQLQTPEQERFWATGWNDCAAAVERTVGHAVLDKVKVPDGVEGRKP